VRIAQIELKNFRCFPAATFDLDNKIILIQGKNGSGKSSLLEALHYLCYLRSFRTTTTRDLIKFGQGGFFVKAKFHEETQSPAHQLQVGFADKKRLVKLNQKTIGTFKELMHHYRVVTLTEDDLALIKAGPDIRRQFLDRALLLQDQEYAIQVRTFRKILENRNTLLQQRSCSQESCMLWTKQLWEHSAKLQKRRIKLMHQLEKKVNQILKKTFAEKLKVSLSYRAKNCDPDASYEQFEQAYNEKSLFFEECRYSRSLFGAHLDDLIITFQDKRTRQYASRGQQKLVVLLFKVAQLSILDSQKEPSVLLLDDFMSDFDQQRIERLTRFLAELPNQIIFTSPAEGGFFDDLVLSLGAKQVCLTT